MDRHMSILFQCYLKNDIEMTNLHLSISPFSPSIASNYARFQEMGHFGRHPFIMSCFIAIKALPSLPSEFRPSSVVPMLPSPVLPAFNSAPSAPPSLHMHEIFTSFIPLPPANLPVSHQIRPRWHTNMTSIRCSEKGRYTIHLTLFFCLC